MEEVAENISNLVIAAYKRISQHIHKTPLEYSDFLSSKNGSAYLKLENLQHTGSFKLRGALSFLTNLSNEGRKKIVTASTGNHGMAVAYSLQKLGGNCKIYLPKGANESKVDKLKKLNAELIFHGIDSVESEFMAKKFANQENYIYLSPYNDNLVIAGQGTIGIELQEQLEKIDNLFVTIGGGGLISGVAGYLKSINPKLKVFGCLPENSPVMSESIKEGKIIEMEVKDTLSDGSSGGIEKDAITFNYCQTLIDEFILVTEDEIQQSIIDVFYNHKQVIEGAAGVAVASFQKIKTSISGNSVIIICGGNIHMPKFTSIICQN